MKRTLLRDGWQVRPKGESFAEVTMPSVAYADITMPHDAVISTARHADGDPAVAYFPGGTWEYRRTLIRDAADAVFRLDFEGVYRDARVYLDGALIGQNANGYTGFTVDASAFCQPGTEHELIVEARCGKDSRWYSGAGIYRPVHLLTAGDISIAPHDLRVRTKEADAETALLETSVAVSSVARTIRTVELRVVVTDPSGADVARSSTPVTVIPGEPAVSRSTFVIERPLLWNEHTPHLYRVSASLHEGESEIDREETPLGIRTVRVDARGGFQINGVSVDLRGACIHHDNGPLGAATYGAAEERRVLLLKEAGFNAIRSSHHPMSIALLEACDRHGMYVMDETFDMWTSGKTNDDYSQRFPTWWERDVEAMVAKDANHPSVVMYSIGNEIGETGSPWGGVVGRRLAEKIRSLDDTRPITNAVNGMLAVIDHVREMAASMGAGDLSDTASINTMMSVMGEMVNVIGTSDIVTERTAESFALLDVAGLNYLEDRYESDRTLFPNRVILGTETYPAAIAKNWGLVTAHPHVIGDFTWTGWDYLGEVGIGRIMTPGPDEAASLAGPYPWLAAWCGDIDLIGTRRPQSFYREIVFGRRAEPYVTVRPPVPTDVTEIASPWSWPDGLDSWTWPGHEGTPMRVEVYSDADQVEILLDGERIAVVDTGADRAFRAATEIAYRPGTLTARAVRSGGAAEEFTLRTAGELAALVATATVASSQRDGNRLAFVTVALADADGEILTHVDRDVTATVTGGDLLAVASGDPRPEDFLAEGRARTFRGRALAIVRLDGDAPSELSLHAADLEPVHISLAAPSR